MARAREGGERLGSSGVGRGGGGGVEPTGFADVGERSKRESRMTPWFLS